MILIRLLIAIGGGSGPFAEIGEAILFLLAIAVGTYLVRGN